MSSHLPLLPYINPCFLSFSFHTSSFQFLKNPSPLKFALPQAQQWRRLEELIPSSRGCARAPLPLPRPPLQEPLTPPAPTPLPLGSSPAAAVGAGPSVPAVRPSAAADAFPAPTAVQGAAAANAEGSSSVAPT